MIKVQDFIELFPKCKEPEEWIFAMEKVLYEYDIDTTKRIAAFITQCGHESGGWRVFSENLNYSAKALNIVFPKYFKRAGRDSEQYHRKPEAIANVVYANRMGNGDIDSGDGWKYRGRGPIQLTGKDNYMQFSKDMCVNVSDPSIVSDDKEIAILSAVWFWNKNNLNDLADMQDIKRMTRKINGGYNGLEERIMYYERAMNILGHSPNVMNPEKIETEEFHIDGIIKRGSRGDEVKIIQRILGLTDDGIFGVNTEQAVKNWQSNSGLVPDGIVGPLTLEKMVG